MTECFPKIQAIEITMEFQQLPRQTETWARRRLGGSALAVGDVGRLSI